MPTGAQTLGNLRSHIPPWDPVVPGHTTATVKHIYKLIIIDRLPWILYNKSTLLLHNMLRWVESGLILMI